MIKDQIDFTPGHHCTKCGGYWTGMCWCTDSTGYEFTEYFRDKFKNKKYLYSNEHFISKGRKALLLDTKEHDNPIYYMFDLQDENNRKALIKAGWTPPKGI